MDKHITDDPFAEYETEDEKAVRLENAKKDAKRHEGAIHGQLGYDFQDFVSAISLIDLARAFHGKKTHRYALSGPFDDPTEITLSQNAPNARIDDLRIDAPTSLFFSQIKKSLGSWNGKIIDEFQNQLARPRDRSRHLILELCLGNEKQAKTLAQNIPERLGAVQISSIDINMMANPCGSPGFEEFVGDVMLPGSRFYAVESAWHQIIVTWVYKFQREGSLHDIFAHASSESKHCIRSMTKVGARMGELLLVLRTALPNLHLASDGTTLLIRERFLLGSVFLTVDVKDEIANLLAAPPGTKDELYEAVGLVVGDE